MDYQKYTNLLGKIPDKVPRFVTKKGIEVHNQPGEKNNNFNKQIGFKTSMLRSDLCVTVMHILLSKELLLLKVEIK